MVKSELKADPPSTSAQTQARSAAPPPSSGTPPTRPNPALALLAPGAVIFGFFLLWYLASLRVHAYLMPSPYAAMIAGIGEIRAGHLANDIVASLFRVALAFTISTVLGVPAGLLLGQSAGARRAFLPLLNFFRFISPLSWIPFAILWFHIGDKPAIFLIFMATFFPIAIATMSAVANIPSIYFRVAKDYNYRGIDLLTKVTFPAVMPQIITALRVSFGIAWVVIVAAEMVGCQDGLGYGIWDARNGLRLDIAVSYMVVIGALGMIFDRLLAQLSKLPNVRWGYER